VVIVDTTLVIRVLVSTEVVLVYFVLVTVVVAKTVTTGPVTVDPTGAVMVTVLAEHALVVVGATKFDVVVELG
jgi:hypothetical protein